MKILDAAFLRERITSRDLLEPTRDAFVALSAGRVRTTADVLDLDDGDVHIKAASEIGGDLYVAKLASLIPSNAGRGLPPGGGAVIVCSALTGEPVALLLDGHYLTDVRTAIAGAIASDLLATPSAATVAVLGSGEQARMQVTALAGLRQLDRVVVWARRPEAAQATAASLRSELGRRTAVDVGTTVEEAISKVAIIVTATASREPLIEAEWLRPGQHLTAIGADDDRKHELATGCFARADRIVVDLRAQTCAKAELAKAIAEGVVEPDEIVEIGEVIAGQEVGRRDSSEITIAKLSGVAAQDLAAVKAVMARTEQPR